MKKIFFNKFYKLFNLISIFLVTLSIVLLIFKGLNYGVDFKGGTLIEIRTSQENSRQFKKIRKIQENAINIL